MELLFDCYMETIKLWLLTFDAVALGHNVVEAVSLVAAQLERQSVVERAAEKALSGVPESAQR